MSVTKVKAVLIGDSGVGKTCLYDRIGQSVFDDDHTPTIGAAFRAVPMRNSAGDSFEVGLWDTAGQERFRTLIPMYFEKAQILIFVYSITDPASLKNLIEWYNLALERSEPDARVFLLGNKCDLDDDRSVSFDALETMATRMNAFRALEVSAKSAMRIDEISDGILKACEGLMPGATPVTTPGSAVLGADPLDDGEKKSDCC
jgi:small GTP-binding protein